MGVIILIQLEKIEAQKEDQIQIQAVFVSLTLLTSSLFSPSFLVLL